MLAGLSAGMLHGSAPRASCLQAVSRVLKADSTPRPLPARSFWTPSWCWSCRADAGLHTSALLSGVPHTSALTSRVPRNSAIYRHRCHVQLLILIKRSSLTRNHAASAGHDTYTHTHTRTRARAHTHTHTHVRPCTAGRARARITLQRARAQALGAPLLRLSRPY